MHQPEPEQHVMKGSVLDRRRKKEVRQQRFINEPCHTQKSPISPCQKSPINLCGTQGAGLSASAGYAKKMAEMAAAQYNSQRAAAAAQEDEGEQDPLTGEISPRIPQVGLGSRV